MKLAKLCTIVDIYLSKIVEYNADGDNDDDNRRDNTDDSDTVVTPLLLRSCQVLRTGLEQLQRTSGENSK